jgi:hypothetical protein
MADPSNPKDQAERTAAGDPIGEEQADEFAPEVANAVRRAPDTKDRDEVAGAAGGGTGTGDMAGGTGIGCDDGGGDTGDGSGTTAGR